MREPIAQQKNIKESSAAYELELAVLSHLITRIKTKDTCADKISIMEETLEIRGSLEATERKLAVANCTMSALKNEQSNISKEMD